ncbi:MAG: putative rane protein, partial [candidate division NC10 bacterium]|nr:putative rane protein [candidate division NC10 bacterium]
MTLTRSLQIYAVTLPIFFAIDLVWLGVVARTFYRQH